MDFGWNRFRIEVCEIQQDKNQNTRRWNHMIAQSNRIRSDGMPVFLQYILFLDNSKRWRSQHRNGKCKKWNAVKRWSSILCCCFVSLIRCEGIPSFIFTWLAINSNIVYHTQFIIIVHERVLRIGHVFSVTARACDVLEFIYLKCASHILGTWPTIIWITLIIRSFSFRQSLIRSLHRFFLQFFVRVCVCLFIRLSQLLSIFLSHSVTWLARECVSAFVYFQYQFIHKQSTFWLFLLSCHYSAYYYHCNEVFFFSLYSFYLYSIDSDIFTEWKIEIMNEWMKKTLFLLLCIHCFRLMFVAFVVAKCVQTAHINTRTWNKSMLLLYPLLRKTIWFN